MEKFESEEYRDQLAVKITQARSTEGRNKAKELLKTEHESLLYKVSELLSKLKNVLPKEYQDYLDEFIKVEDSEEVLEKFEVKDISSLLTLEHKLFIEAEILEHFVFHKHGYKVPDQIKAYFEEIKTLLFPQSDTFKCGIDSGPKLFNEITEGKFLDNRNVNHVVNAERNNIESLIKPFAFESQILQSHSIYLCAGDNGYAQQISKPLVIFEPSDLNARKFIEEGYDFQHRPILDNAELRKDKNGNVGYFVYSIDGRLGTQQSSLYRLLFLANYPILPGNVYNELVLVKTNNKNIEYKWSEVASEVVNLPAGKLYKRRQTPEEAVEVDESIKYYRDLLKVRLGIDFERDKDRKIKTLKNNFSN